MMRSVLIKNNPVDLEQQSVLPRRYNTVLVQKINAAQLTIKKKQYPYFDFTLASVVSMPALMFIAYLFYRGLKADLAFYEEFIHTLPEEWRRLLIANTNETCGSRYGEFDTYDSDDTPSDMLEGVAEEIDEGVTCHSYHSLEDLAAECYDFLNQVCEEYAHAQLTTPWYFIAIVVTACFLVLAMVKTCEAQAHSISINSSPLARILSSAELTAIKELSEQLQVDINDNTLAKEAIAVLEAAKNQHFSVTTAKVSFVIAAKREPDNHSHVSPIYSFFARDQDKLCTHHILDYVEPAMTHQSKRSFS